MDLQEHCENALRPSRYLGYDNDRLGMYFLDMQANALAEAEFRRAVWLNLYEMDFQVHLAMCLFKQKKYVESRDMIQQIVVEVPDRSDACELLRQVTARLNASVTGHSFGPDLP